MPELKEVIYLLFLFCVVVILAIPQQVSAVEDSLDNGVKLIADNLQVALSSLSKPRPIRIAILPLRWEKEDQWDLCRVASELLRTQISHKEGVLLIERDLSVQAVSSLKMDLPKGLLEPDKITELKQKLNCDAIITGYIADLNTIININMFLWNVDDGSLLVTASARVRKTSAIVSLLTSPYEAQAHDYYSVKWISQPLPYRILAISVSDIDKDNINEIILATEGELKVLSWDGFSFRERVTAYYTDPSQLRRNQQDIRTLFGLDMDEDSGDEVCVSIPEKETSVWKWESDSLVKIRSLPFTLLAVQNTNLIFGSLKQNRNYFSGSATYQTLNNSRTDRPLPVDYYSIAIGETNNTEGKEWLVVDAGNLMRVYSENMESLWQSTMNFGTGIAIADLDGNGKNEIIGTSAMPRGKWDSLIILEWDGSSYPKKWESQPIKGTASALCVGDPNNDGMDELVVAVYEQGRSEICLYTANYIHR